VASPPLGWHTPGAYVGSSASLLPRAAPEGRISTHAGFVVSMVTEAMGEPHAPSA
jgi:hypothetical protein